VQELITKRISFGGGCINDTIIHLATTQMGFGGVGESGTGAYHGKAGFDTFTHYKSMVDKANWIDLNMRYQPYDKKKLGMIKKILK
jgi:aldehyde dehydrogenase (NAD+)